MSRILNMLSKFPAAMASARLQGRFFLDLGVDLLLCHSGLTSQGEEKPV
jgi:hypothetical protein